VHNLFATGGRKTSYQCADGRHDGSFFTVGNKQYEAYWHIVMSS